MTTPRRLPKQVRAAWEKERDEFSQGAQRIDSEARAYDCMAATLTYDPALAQHYRDLAERERQRAQFVREHSQQIQDYLDGKIDPWW